MSNLNIAADDLPQLTPLQRDGLLQRMGLLETGASTNSVSVSSFPRTLEALSLLQWRYLCSSVFHNLYLLAGADGYPAPLSAEASLRSILNGHGGPCHVQATGFLCLLRSLGFNAHFAAARINAPLDHLTIIVHIQEGGFVCDVGNGHPYRRPFPLHQTLQQDWLGWQFRGESIDGAFHLRRLIHHGRHSRWKTVYYLDPQPRSFAAFAPSLQQHHSHIGFGPFLANLRAVRISEHGLLSLRNGCYERYTRYGHYQRPVASEAAAYGLLQEVFGLHHAPLQQALAVYQRNQPRPWVQALEAPTLLISLAATGHAHQLSSFGAWLKRHFSADSAMLLVENSTDASIRHVNREKVELLRQSDVRVEYFDDGHYGRPIAAARRAQVRCLAQWSGATPDMVWMIDDDLALRHLCLEQGRRVLREVDNMAAQLLDLYHAHPHISMILGGVSGDPPIRPDAVLRTQLFDLLANLAWFAALTPAASYPSPRQEVLFALTDYYYDHSEAGGTHLCTPFRWQAQDAGGDSVREQFLAYIQAAHGIPLGKAVTRPLLYRPETPLRHSVLRGGNTLFFDVDAVFAHAYPDADICGITTRRADMIGAALLQREYPVVIMQAPLPLLHQRDARQTGQNQRQSNWVSLCSEFFGVLLAHAVIADKAFDFAQAARQRAERISENIRLALQYLDAIENNHTTEARAWWIQDPEANDALTELLQHLRRELAVYLSPDNDGKTLTAALSDLAADPTTHAALQCAYAQLPQDAAAWQQEIAQLSQTGVIHE